MTVATVGIDDVAAALDHAGIPHERRGDRIETGCPACGKTGTRGRRKILISSNRSRDDGHHTEVYCGCRIVDIAHAISLPPASLLSYTVTRVPDLRDGESKTDRDKTGRPSYANRRGSTQTETEVRRLARGNPRGLIRLARDLDRLGISTMSWVTYDQRRGARELGSTRETIRRDLRWLVEHGIVLMQKLPAPDVLVDREDCRRGSTYKSGARRYRLPTPRERAQWEADTWAEWARRLSVRATPDLPSIAPPYRPSFEAEMSAMRRERWRVVRGKPGERVDWFAASRPLRRPREWG